MLKTMMKNSLSYITTMAVLSLTFHLNSVTSTAAALTYFWNVYQSDFPGPATVPVPDPSGKILTTVSPAFWTTLHMEGTGVLNDGRTITCYDDGCTTFFVTSKPQGFNGQPLVPFKTLAINVVPINSGIFIAEFKGVRMPDGNTHNGCFIAGDHLGNYDPTGQHIDFYSGSMSNYNAIQRVMPKNTVNYTIMPNCTTSTQY